ncbi:MAG: phage BR0599 family protein [Acidobacteriota bacterium]|nr:phage BR0599 family protein [Acidobacteriota bacterium]
MSLLADESGIETSQPREGIEITTGTGLIPTVYRIATGTRDVVINGFTFYASPAQRGSVKIASSNDGADLEITLPVSHPVPQRYLQGGVPPRQISVVVWRKQTTSGESERIWSGRATSMACEGHTAILRVPSRMTEAYQRRLPTITAGRMCPHILYDENCRVNRNSYRIDGVANAVSGLTVRVNTAVEPVIDWATFGELHHVASGESVTISEQKGGTDIVGPHMMITVQLPISVMQAGDAVTVYAGCAHTIAVCRTKFANVENFGGFPAYPSINPFYTGVTP